MITARANYKNCYELTDLPYFEKNEAGRPTLAIDLPPIVDFHTHFAFGIQLTRGFDLHKKTETVMHSFREDSVAVDMNVYSGVNLSKQRREGMFKEFASALFSNGGAVGTYTVPNLLAEMDRMGVEKSVLLAIDPPGSFHVSQSYIENTAKTERLIPFCGINPRSPRWEEHMDKCLEMGARGIKIHPYLQGMPPSDRRVLKLIERWSKSGYPVLFHTSHNGLEPAILRKLSDIEHYAAPLKKFPNTMFVFGHAGMGDYAYASKIAKAHGNTYLEIGGQPAAHIRKIIEILGNDRVLFGTDWPVYPLVLPLAKLLIATEGDEESRTKILNVNANRIIKERSLCAV